MNIYLSFPNAS